jgi:cohesin loading factor subunit SCC2
VTRHFNPIAVSASPASYTHPQYYAPSNAAYQQMRAQPYGEYENEIRYLQSTQVPPNDGGYWTQTRDEAVRYLNEQNNGCVYFYVRYGLFSHSR